MRRRKLLLTIINTINNINNALYKRAKHLFMKGLIILIFELINNSDTDNLVLTSLLKSDIINVEELEKSMPGKVPVKLTVTRNGKTFQQTFWKSPQEAKKLLQGRIGQKPTDGRLAFTTDEKTIATFQKKVSQARESVAIDKRWRVDDGHDANDYKEHNTKVLVTKGGSTVAVTGDGDIISVCRHKGDKVTGPKLLEMAVKQGGIKLDSFDGNYQFYIENGFEPVSWCEFDSEYAPKGWKEANVPPEQVIFFKYTGKKSSYATEKDFYDKVESCKGYTKEDGEFVDPYTHAMKTRDKTLKEKEND